MKRLTIVAALALFAAPALAQTPASPPPAGTPTTGQGTGTGTGAGTAGTARTGTAPGAATDAKTADPAAQAGEGPPPAEILTKLHHSNQMEIAAGKLAVEKGASKEVKSFGKALVRDHTAADKQVKALAKQLKVELPAMPADMKHDKLEKAKEASGAEFDKAFAEAMVDEHKKDVEEAAEARDKTTNPRLKKLLAGLVPKLEKHRETAQKLADGDMGAAKAKEGAEAPK